MIAIRIDTTSVAIGNITRTHSPNAFKSYRIYRIVKHSSKTISASKAGRQARRKATSKATRRGNRNTQKNETTYNTTKRQTKREAKYANSSERYETQQTIRLYKQACKQNKQSHDKKSQQARKHIEKKIAPPTHVANGAIIINRCLSKQVR